MARWTSSAEQGVWAGGLLAVIALYVSKMNRLSFTAHVLRTQEITSSRGVRSRRRMACCGSPLAADEVHLAPRGIKWLALARDEVRRRAEGGDLRPDSRPGPATTSVWWACAGATEGNGRWGSTSQSPSTVLADEHGVLAEDGSDSATWDSGLLSNLRRPHRLIGRQKRDQLVGSSCALRLRSGTEHSSSVRSRARMSALRPVIFARMCASVSMPTLPVHSGGALSILVVVFGLEAAHITWHAGDGPDLVPNGLVLCTLHHKALDRGASVWGGDSMSTACSCPTS